MLSNEWAYEWMWDKSGNEHFYVFTINHTNYWDRICSSDSLNNLGDVNERIDIIVIICCFLLPLTAKTYFLFFYFNFFDMLPLELQV